MIFYIDSLETEVAIQEFVDLKALQSSVNASN